MKRTLSILFLIGSGLIILDCLDFGHTLILFFMAGVLPGTNITLSPVDTMAAFATAFTITLLRLAFWGQAKEFFFCKVEKEVPKQTAHHKLV